MHHLFADFLPIAFDVLTYGKSLFVISSAEEFISELWCRTKNLVLREEANSELTSVLKQIHQKIWTMIEAPVNDSKGKTSLGGESSVLPYQGCLSALEILKQFHGRTEHGFQSETEKLNVLMNCLLHKPASAMVIMDLLQKWYVCLQWSSIWLVCKTETSCCLLPPFMSWNGWGVSLGFNVDNLMILLPLFKNTLICNLTQNIWIQFQEVSYLYKNSMNLKNLQKTQAISFESCKFVPLRHLSNISYVLVCIIIHISCMFKTLHMAIS